MIENPSRVMPREPMTMSKPWACQGKSWPNSAMGVD